MKTCLLVGGWNQSAYSHYGKMVGGDEEANEECILFSCQFCNQVFMGAESSAQHSKQCHLIPGRGEWPNNEKPKLPCLVCEDTFEKVGRLVKHLVTKHTNRRTAELAEGRAIIDLIEQQMWSETQVCITYTRFS